MRPQTEQAAVTRSSGGGLNGGVHFAGLFAHFSRVSHIGSGVFGRMVSVRVRFGVANHRAIREKHDEVPPHDVPALPFCRKISPDRRSRCWGVLLVLTVYFLSAGLVGASRARRS